MSAPIPLRYWNVSEDRDFVIPPGRWPELLPNWWAARRDPQFVAGLGIRMSDGSLLIVRSREAHR